MKLLGEVTLTNIGIQDQQAIQKRKLWLVSELDNKTKFRIYNNQCWNNAAGLYPANKITTV